jgi:hypothetical protein
MARYGRVKIALGLVAVTAASVTDWVLAQTATTPTTPPLTAPVEAPASGYGGLILLALVAVSLTALIMAIRLYDMKRRQEESAMILQAKLSDALLLDPSLSEYPITATVHVPMRQRSRVTVDIAGSVPSPELRGAALQIVKRQTAGLRREVRIEDRMIVNPAVARHAA